MVHREPMRHTRATVVRQHAEALEAVMPHGGECIERHLPLAVDRVFGIGRRPARIAVAAQVDRDHREPLHQCRRHAMPDRMCLRMTVQQQQGALLPPIRPWMRTPLRSMSKVEGKK